MWTDPNTVRLLARSLYSTLTNRLRGLAGDLLAGLWGGRRLTAAQRDFLLGDLRLELETAVEDAERHAISDEDAIRIAHIRSPIRWLEYGELPGPEAIPYLERQLGGIPRRADPHEIIERKALIAAIYELGGNGRAAAGIYEKTHGDEERGPFARLSSNF
ncbi:MAG: hypothetical protein JSS68_20375 [Actinobacteria bacterium]|nr:hypothetical protein [Actinomycetota bacterium]